MPTDVHIDDDGFVRAPHALVYRHLTDLAGYADWWHGVTVTPVASAPDTPARFQLRLQRTTTRAPGLRVPVPSALHGRVRRLDLQAEPHAYRHDAGFRLRLHGDLEGEAEWWLEPGWGGTVVHHLLTATARGDARTSTALYRAVLRRGLWATKDRLQSLTRETVGLTP